MTDESIVRKRGAPAGNQNARTHGFYAKKLSKKEQAALEDASAVRGVDNEIALLRVKIGSIIDSDPQNVRVLTAAITALVKLLKLKFAIGGAGAESLPEAVERALVSLGAPLMRYAPSTPLGAIREAAHGTQPIQNSPTAPEDENHPVSQAQPGEIK